MVLNVHRNHKTYSGRGEGGGRGYGCWGRGRWKSENKLYILGKLNSSLKHSKWSGVHSLLLLFVCLFVRCIFQRYFSQYFTQSAEGLIFTIRISMKFQQNKAEKHRRLQWCYLFPYCNIHNNNKKQQKQKCKACPTRMLKGMLHNYYYLFF